MVKFVGSCITNGEKSFMITGCCFSSFQGHVEETKTPRSQQSAINLHPWGSTRSNSCFHSVLVFVMVSLVLFTQSIVLFFLSSSLC